MLQSEYLMLKRSCSHVHTERSSQVLSVAEIILHIVMTASDGFDTFMSLSTAVSFYSQCKLDNIFKV